MFAHELKPQTRVMVDLYTIASIPTPRESVPGQFLGRMAAPHETYSIALDSGPIIGAGVMNGRFVFGPGLPASAENPGPSELADGVVMAADPEAPAPVAAVGIVYLGPPDQYARDQVAAAFGKHAHHISHAKATKEQWTQYHQSDPRAEVTILVGRVSEANTGTMLKVSDIVRQMDSALFPGIVGVLPEQIDEAKLRHPYGELSPLFADAASAAV